jgi:hypothetical protein
VWTVGARRRDAYFPGVRGGVHAWVLLLCRARPPPTRDAANRLLDKYLRKRFVILQRWRHEHRGDGGDDQLNSTIAYRDIYFDHT